MSKSLYLGPDLSLPLSAITGTFGILGIRGCGKTTTSVDIAEEIVKAQYPVAVIDPLDVWRGIRTSADGKKPGLPVYIFGGRHADAPLEPTSGVILARFLMKNRVPIVLSLKGMTHAAQARFVKDFATELYMHNDEPLHVILDEAKRFAPQNFAGRPDLAQCANAVQMLGTEGRASGIGFTIIGQRASQINKDVLSQCETVIAMRTQGAHDRKALQEWVESHATDEQLGTMMRELGSLPTGTGFVWSPVANIFKRVRFRARETFDSSRTPKVGEKRKAPTAFAPVDLEALRGEISAAIEAARVDDPGSLRDEIARLKRELTEVKSRPASQPEIVQVPILSADDRDALQAAVAAVSGASEAAARLVAAIASLEAVAQRLKGAMAAADRLGSSSAQEAPATRAPRRSREASSSAPPSSSNVRPVPPAPTIATGNGSGLPAGARRMLAQLARCGGTLTKRELSTLADVQIRNGTLAAYMRQLVQNGYVEDGGSSVHLLDAGEASIGERLRNDPPRTDEIVQIYARKLPAGARRMLDALVAAYPRDVVKADLSEETGVQIRNGTFAAYFRKLHGFGLAEERGSKLVHAADTLFIRIRNGASEK